MGMTSVRIWICQGSARFGRSDGDEVADGLEIIVQAVEADHVDVAVAASPTVTDVTDELELELPAVSVSLAVTLNVPWPCAAIVPRGTVTVALLPEMSPSPPGACR